MLADKVVEWGTDPRLDWSMLGALFPQPVNTALHYCLEFVQNKDTQRFVLSPQIARLTAELAVSASNLKAISETCVLPAENTWLEFTVADCRSILPDRLFSENVPGRMLGVGNIERRLKKIGVVLGGFPLNKGDPPINAATCCVVVETTSGEFGFATAFNLYFEDGVVNATSGVEFIQQDIPIYSAFIAAACAVINTPKIFAHEDSDLDRLNISRARKGLMELLPYRQVTMPRELASDLDKARGEAHGAGHMGKRKYHHVHTFIRIKNGKIEKVRPHWRGDPRLGVSSHDTAVRHTGEHIQREKGQRVITR